MVDEIRYCEDCKWLKAGSAPVLHQCVNPKNVSASSPYRFVSRNQYPIAGACRDQREKDTLGGEETCGPAGRWFEPKEAAL